MKDKNKQLCLVGKHGHCCCGCRYHVEDFHHCTTVTAPRDKCVCHEPKGWICMPPDSPGAYSGWTEHGLCEMWGAKEGK